jgi:hypothetical protein
MSMQIILIRISIYRDAAISPQTAIAGVRRTALAAAATAGSQGAGGPRRRSVAEIGELQRQVELGLADQRDHFLQVVLLLPVTRTCWSWIADWTLSFESLIRR